jgi:hypothetical protein
MGLAAAKLVRLQEFEKEENSLLGGILPRQVRVVSDGFSHGGVKHRKESEEEKIGYQAVSKNVLPFREFKQNVIRRAIGASRAEMRKKELGFREARKRRRSRVQDVVVFPGGRRVKLSKELCF